MIDDCNMGLVELLTSDEELLFEVVLVEIVSFCSIIPGYLGGTSLYKRKFGVFMRLYVLFRLFSSSLLDDGLTLISLFVDTLDVGIFDVLN